MKVAPLPEKVQVQVEPRKQNSISTISSNDSPTDTAEVDYRPGKFLVQTKLTKWFRRIVRNRNAHQFSKGKFNRCWLNKTQIQGMIGPGCLSLPLALKQAGLWTALVLIFVFGFLNNYCMLQLVRSSQRLSRKKGQVLDYSGVAYEACAQSFRPLRRYKNYFRQVLVLLGRWCNANLLRFLANAVIFSLQVGICAVYYVFISTHLQEIVEQETSFRISSTMWSLIIFIPMMLVNLLRNLKTIAILSLFGNISMILSLIFVMQVRANALF